MGWSSKWVRMNLAKVKGSERLDLFGIPFEHLSEFPFSPLRTFLPNYKKRWSSTTLFETFLFVRFLFVKFGGHIRKTVHGPSVNLFLYLQKMLGKNTHILPNCNLMVIFHGTIRKKAKTHPSWLDVSVVIFNLKSSTISIPNFVKNQMCIQDSRNHPNTIVQVILVCCASMHQSQWQPRRHYLPTTSVHAFCFSSTHVSSCQFWQISETSSSPVSVVIRMHVYQLVHSID